jgi:hypothetical protein
VRGSDGVELGVDKNSTVVFPAPLMSTIGELSTFLARENSAALASPAHGSAVGVPPVVNGKPLPVTTS